VIDNTLSVLLNIEREWRSDDGREWAYSSRLWKDRAWSPDFLSPPMLDDTKSDIGAYKVYSHNNERQFFSSYATMPVPTGIYGKNVYGVVTYDNAAPPGPHQPIPDPSPYSLTSAIRWSAGQSLSTWQSTLLYPPTGGSRVYSISFCSGGGYYQPINAPITSPGGALLHLTGPAGYPPSEEWLAWAAPTDAGSSSHVPGTGQPNWQKTHSNFANPLGLEYGSYSVDQMVAIEDGGSAVGSRGASKLAVLYGGAGGDCRYDKDEFVVENGAETLLPRGKKMYPGVMSISQVKKRRTGTQTTLVVGGGQGLTKDNEHIPGLTPTSILWAKKDRWRKTNRTPSIGNILAISKDGILLGKNAIWRNGKAVPLDTLVAEIKSNPQNPNSPPRYSNLQGLAMNGEGAIVAVADDTQNPGQGYKTVMVLLPVDLDIVHPATGELAESDQHDATKGGYVAVHRGTVPDAAEPISKLVIRASNGIPRLKWRLHFDRGTKFDLFKDSQLTQYVFSDSTEFDSAQDVTLYFKGHEKSASVGVQSITLMALIDGQSYSTEKVYFTVVEAQIFSEVRFWIREGWIPVPFHPINNPLANKIAGGDDRDNSLNHTERINNTF
jgi:hypothetical protein